MTKTGKRVVMLVLGLLTASAPLSIDMYLPALPAMEQVFAVGSGRIQLTLAAFFFGFALSQAFYGPITDRFGRMLVIAPTVSVVCAVTGLYLSYYLDTASGGMVVLTQGAMFVLVFLFSPSHGVVGAKIAARRRRRVRGDRRGPDPSQSLPASTPLRRRRDGDPHGERP